jgi:hypothetical protein
MKVYCKNNCQKFKKGKYYEVISIASVFEQNDFITIQNDYPYRFRLNTSKDFIEDFIGENEYYFYNYFYDIREERKIKLEQLSKIN